MVKSLPHAQVVGTLSGCQPYLKARASRNADLWREKPNSEIGRVVSQLERVHIPRPSSSVETLAVLCALGGCRDERLSFEAK